MSHSNSGTCIFSAGDESYIVGIDNRRICCTAIGLPSNTPGATGSRCFCSNIPLVVAGNNTFPHHIAGNTARSGVFACNFSLIIAKRNAAARTGHPNNTGNITPRIRCCLNGAPVPTLSNRSFTHADNTADVVLTGYCSNIDAVFNCATRFQIASNTADISRLSAQVDRTCNRQILNRSRYGIK
ncbi:MULTISPECIES: hypothetical protein [Lawsonibacter]|uniref:hypothetical protein n=1 Tax=Lawsonibacter TaxID=2172004 RepID=UPI00258D7F90|nr:hypothetical protein [Lawsonibacter sp.]MCI6399826.1 hypothetical protein [Lawsonibacter sp.]